MDSVCEYMILVPTTECQTSDTSMVSVAASNMLGPGQSSGPVSLGQCWYIIVIYMLVCTYDIVCHARDVCVSECM